MTLSPAHQALAAAHISNPDASTAVVFGICWPNESALASDLLINVNAGDTLDQAADSLGLAWGPQWLVDAGYEVFDAGGTDLATGAVAAVSGPIQWQPAVRLARVDDGVKDTVAKTSKPYLGRIAGEVALTAFWTESAFSYGIADQRPYNLDRNVRGARFRDFLVYFLEQQIPAGWRILPEIKLSDIRGLHMRQNVGERSGDIAVIDDQDRLVAVVSSKWTWRSDRGTEAAQMVFLTRYRPDVPYAMVTAEFPRSATLGRESIEDRAYHVCPVWVGAWRAIKNLATGLPRIEWPSLADLHVVGRSMADVLLMPGLEALVKDLASSGRIF